MLFNSLDFALFLPIVFVLYWLLFQKNLKAQNALVLVASYVFYGWWDWSFLWLILFSTLVNYFFAIGLGKYEKERTRKLLLWASLAVNLGFLGFFKYYNFFLDNVVQAFSFFGHPISIQGLDIVLPIGISFYTFQTMSYTMDVYYEKLKPTKDIIAFGAFVSFFPQLIAGPIEHATNLLPQFHTKRTLDFAKAVDGCRQILWGLFKKIVIADNCAEYANKIFENYQDYNGATLLLGAVFYAFQIYGDFSGYSDIAIGTSSLLGFSLMPNFAFPYFSKSIPEFWKRWHISLTTWFAEYLFFPLAFSLRKLKKYGIILSIVIVFFISGLWHGPSWHYILWGLFHGLLFIPSILKTGTNPFNQNKLNAPTLKDVHLVLSTFFIICFTSIFFRANDVSQAVHFIKGIATLKSGISLNINGINLYQFVVTIIAIVYLMLQDYHLMKKSKFGLLFLPTTLFMIFYFGHFKSTASFIYFQF
jgi:D-alanyl-lipoteichoic acid acyltransferase DltB (MBOAT superfamily)